MRSVRGTLCGSPNCTVMTCHSPVLMPVVVTDAARPSPSIASVTPSSGMGGTAVTIRGANFAPPCRVMLGADAAADVRVADGGTITAVVPPRVPGSVALQIICGTAAAKVEDAFRYLAARRRSAR
jgi:hypothetical protein